MKIDIKDKDHIPIITMEELVEEGGKEWWSHYCKKQDDIMTFQKGFECDWCGEVENESKTYKSFTA